MRKCLTICLLMLACRGVQAQSLTADSAAINKLPSIPFLPSPLILDEGGKNIPVKTTAQWQQKRSEIRKQYQHWVSGTVPPAPASISVEVLSERTENNVKIRLVQLSFGPGNRAKMTLELMIPPSAGRLPVFMTQWNHRGWAQIAVRRGYIGCVYAGADGKDDTRNYNEIFTGYDFATLMKRAWGASRVVDYLVKLPEVDTACIAITGHSRNGKQSLMAAAFDERIKAVVSSSGGTGGESTFRFSDERFESESVEEITRVFPQWFHARLRLFSGREQQLPVDQNLLMSLVAPRGLMMVSAITETQGNGWGIEQSYKSVSSAYHFLHADKNIALLLRHGRHQHAAREAEDFIDFFDYIFHRTTKAPENKMYYGYSFEKWQQHSGEHIDPAQWQPRATLSADSLIHWLLGNEPPGIASDRALSPVMTRNHTYPDDYLSEVIGERPLPNSMAKMVVGPYNALGEDLWGNIYFPSEVVKEDSVAGKLPLVILLHDYSYATGSHQRLPATVRRFTEKGYAVLTFDFPGFGTRVEEAASFYTRYPHWSLMGKMVADTRGIINDAYTRMSFVDTSHIYLAGYSLGGTVALLTTALDPRVKGVAAVAAFGSLRHAGKSTEGIQHYSHLHGLIPRLGFFEGAEENIPVDFDDVIRSIGSRPVLIVAPQQDRHHPLPEVRQLVTPVMQTNKQLTFETPNDYGRFTAEMQEMLAGWLQAQRK